MRLLILFLSLLTCSSAVAQTVVSDDFNSGTLDTTTKWTIGTKRFASFDSASVTVQETSGVLRITPPTAPAASHIRGVYSKSAAPFQGRLITGKAVQPFVITTSFNSWTNFCAVKDESNYFCLLVQFRDLSVDTKQNGVAGKSYQVPLQVQGILEERHLYWRIKHNQSTNVIAFQTSWDGVEWIDIIPSGIAVTTDITTSDWHLEMSAGSTVGTSSVTPVDFDDAFYGRPTMADGGVDRTARSGTSLQLNGGNSFGASSYSWSCVGPNTPTITGATTATPTISNLIAGEYTCTLSINSGAATDEIRLGVVDADPTTYRITGLPAWAELIVGGSLTMSGSPVIPNVTWYEATRQREIYYWATSHPSKPPRTTLTGTVNVVNGSPNVVCATGNCQFTARIETNKLVNANMRDYITIDDGGTTRSVKVASIEDDNHLTLTTSWAFTSRTGVAWGTNFIHPITGSQAHGVYLEASRYDFATFCLEEYYRSGLTKWLTLFRKMADSRWASQMIQYGCDCAGADGPNSYYGEFKTLIARAADGRPEMWDWLYRWVNTSYISAVWNEKDSLQVRATVVNRGTGYTSAPSCTVVGTGTGAACAAFLGYSADGSDATKVNAVNITNLGSGYTSATIILSGGGGSGASFTIGVDAGRLSGIKTLPFFDDTRTVGYLQEDAALIAALLPNTYTNYANGTEAASSGSTLDGAVKRASLLVRITEGALGYFGGKQNPEGSWRWDIVGGDDPYQLYNQPFMDGIAQWGLVRTHQVIVNPADKIAILAILKKSLDYVFTTYGGNKQILNCTSPARYWRTALYDARGGPASDQDLFDPPYTIWNAGTSQGCNPPTEARGGRYPQTFWIWPSVYYFRQTGNTTYRVRADDLYNSLFGGMDEVDVVTGLIGDGAFSPGSYEIQSTKSKEAAESFLYTAGYSSLRVAAGSVQINGKFTISGKVVINE